MLGLCDRFKVLPSQLDAEGVELLRMIEIERLGTPESEEASWPGQSAA